MKINQIKDVYKNVEKRILRESPIKQQETPQKGLLSRNTKPKNTQSQEMEPMDIVAEYMKSIRARRGSMQ